MLKNLSPVITGNVLRQLDELKPGEYLAVVSNGFPLDRVSSPVVEIPAAGVEQTAEAVFSVVPLAADPAAVLCWFPEDATEDALDVAFAVQGLATDAEARPVEVRLLEEAEFAGYLDGAAAVFRATGTAEPSAFLFHAGAH